MGRASRDKGKRGERELVGILQAAGLEDARRTAPMQAGYASDGEPDVRAWFTVWECKRGKRESIPAPEVVLSQARLAAGIGEWPLGYVREDRRAGEAVVALEDLVELHEHAARAGAASVGELGGVAVRLPVEHAARLIALAKKGAER